MPNPSEDNAFLNEPLFGTPPPAGGFGRQRRTYAFEKILDKVRMEPGRDAKIAEWKVTNDMGSKVCTTRCNSARSSVWSFLVKYHPLENWMVYSRSSPGTWGDKELWAVYLGDMTPEEALKVKTMRKDAMLSDPTKTKRENTEAKAQRRAVYLDYQMQRKRAARG